MSIAFLYPEGKLKALTFSYDDGMVYDRRLVSLFNQYGLKSSFFLNSGVLGAYHGRIEPEEIRNLYSGHEVACHTLTHPYLERMPLTEVMREIWLDRMALENFTGTLVTGMSYPLRNYTDDVITICRSAGIQYARGANSTRAFNLPADFMRWMPTCHHREALELIPAFKQLNDERRLALFYIWGHSFELERNTGADSWSQIEKICSSLAGDPQVWYATNIEIFRYVNAIRTAIVSCDGNLIHNPSGVTLWLKTPAEQLRTILPGQTINLD